MLEGRCGLCEWRRGRLLSVAASCQGRGSVFGPGLILFLECRAALGCRSCLCEGERPRGVDPA
eukprot:14348126-Alexandrium_andersonii.AAC.1